MIFGNSISGADVAEGRDLAVILDGSVGMDPWAQELQNIYSTRYTVYMGVS